MAQTPSSFSLPLGSIAPSFTLFEPKTGEHLSLAEIMGAEGTLILFACNHCPYVVHLGKALGQWSSAAGLLGVNTVAINSNDSEAYPADAPELMPAFAKEMGWDFPYLFDESQDVARAYGAACTPDFFLFDSEGKLFYAGAFDTSRPGQSTPVTGQNLQNALLALFTEQPAPKPFLPSLGCGLKWKP